MGHDITAISEIVGSEKDPSKDDQIECDQSVRGLAFHEFGQMKPVHETMAKIERGMIESPDHKGPFGPVPKAADDKHEQNIAGPFHGVRMISSQRLVHII